MRDPHVFSSHDLHSTAFAYFKTSLGAPDAGQSLDEQLALLTHIFGLAIR